jgi:hypothetical protein
MDRKNLANTYMKKVGVKQVIDEMQRPAPVEARRPVSAGGPAERPITLSQEYLQFILGTDEVPAWMREKAPLVATRMNQLTIIHGDFDFERMLHGVRAILTMMQWDGELEPMEAVQFEYFIGVQLRRSRDGKQLRYVAPGYSQILHEESSATGTVIDGTQNQNAAIGLFGNKKGGRGF